jgi:hypothetical protein
MLSVAVNVPAAAGVNVTSTVQDWPAASGLPPQLLVWVKSLGLVPVFPMADTEREALPELVIVNGRVLVEPTAVAGKLNDVADSFAIGLKPSQCRSS